MDIVADFYTLPGTPSDLLTSTRIGKRRLAVDNRDTCFFEGRQGYVIIEFDIPEDQTEVLKFVSPVNIIVNRFRSTLILGAARIELLTGGTEGGEFNGEIDVKPVNRMTTVSPYDLQVEWSKGGTHTGGTLQELLLLNAGSPARQARADIGADELPVAFAPGTFYVRIESTSNSSAQGIFRARWEENP